jgi:hypothetical protein
MFEHSGRGGLNLSLSLVGGDGQYRLTGCHLFTVGDEPLNDGDFGDGYPQAWNDHISHGEPISIWCREWTVHDLHAARTDSTMRATEGRCAASSCGEYGTGVYSAPTRRIGAAKVPQSSWLSHAAISAPTPKR